MNAFGSLATLWWVRLPASFGRLTRLLGSLSSDGDYLLAWKPVAAFGPLVCLLFGFLTGWVHFTPGLTYTNALVIMALYVLLSGLGGGLGWWLLIGYIAGDFILFGHRRSSNESILDNIVFVRSGLILAYLLLAKLVSLTPLVSRGLREQLIGRLHLTGPTAMVVKGALQGALQAGLVWVWVQATPSLIRPVFTWRGSTPSYEAMAPLQESGMVLVVLALLMGILRAALESLPAAQSARAAARKERAVLQPARATPAKPLPMWLSSALRAAFATFMLGGIIGSWREAVLFFAVFTAVQVLRSMMASRLAPLARFMARVPIVLRLALGGAVSYLMAWLVVPAFWSGGGWLVHFLTDTLEMGTFLPMLLTTGVSLTVFTLLMPPASTGATPGSGGQGATTIVRAPAPPGAPGEASVPTVVMNPEVRA